MFGIVIGPTAPGQNFATGDALSALISFDKHDTTVKNAKQTLTGQLKDNEDIVQVRYEVYAEVDQGALSFQGDAGVTNNAFTLENIMLKPGDNTIAVTALTAGGKKGTGTINVTYDSDSIKDIPIKNVAKAYPDNDMKYANNNLLVFFEKDTDDIRRQAIIDTVGGKCVGYINGIHMWQVEVKPDSFEGLNKIAERLMAMEDVSFAGCNMVGAAAPMVTIPEDPWYSNGSPPWSEFKPKGGNWSVEAIQALYAWDYQYFFNNIKVGIVDAGVQHDHEDLIGKVSFPDSQSAGDNDPYDNHGTHVAGIMGAIPNNGKGVTGILWDTTMYAYNWEVGAGSDAQVLAGLTKTVEAGAKVVNFSLGLGDDISGYGVPSINPSVIYYANLSKSYMAPLLDAGYDFIVVQSAGNGQGGYSQDAIYNGYFCSITNTNLFSISTEMKQKINERIIIVGSADYSGDLAFFQAPTSNAGSQVDICAPGVSIYSCYANDQYNYMSGTSMASPVAAAVTALAWSVNPTLTGAQVRSIVLNNTSYTVKDNTSAYHPLVNTYRMVSAKLAVEAVIATIPVDYSAVDAAVAAADMLDASLYTYQSWADLTDAVDSVVYNLESKYQVQINTMAQNINTAITNLVLETVSYTVEYRLNSETGNKIAPNKPATGQVTKTVSETAVVIEGHEAIVKTKNLTLTPEINKIIFIYVVSPIISAQINLYKDVSGTLIPVTAAKPNEIITVKVTPVTNFYCGTSRFVVMYDKNFYTMMGNGTGAFTPNNENDYFQNAVSNLTGTTITPPPEAWPTTFTGGESALYNFAAVVFNAGPSSANGGYPLIQNGETSLFSFKLKVKADATGSGRIFMDNKWTRRTPAFPGGDQYFYLCPNGSTQSSGGTTAMNFTGDFSLADKSILIDTSVNISFALNGGTGTAPAVQSGEPGSILVFPDRTGFDRPYYSFLGWATTPEASQPLESYTLPANDTVLYAIWRMTPVAITARNGSTTVINGEYKFIYGLAPGITQSVFENAYIELTGNARLEYSTFNGGFGSGTIVYVIDNDTQAILESYRIVIFGDVNGDGNADSIDAGLMIDFENYILEFDAATGAALRKAADLNGDGNIDSTDAGIAVDAENFLVTIDQATGLS